MKKNKLSKKNVLVLLISMFFVGLVIFSGNKIINYLNDNHKNKIIKENIIKNSITIIDPPNKEEDTRYDVDFKELKKQNSDTVAYLKVNGTNIDYIVVRGLDNSYYLNHNFEKNVNVSGWIFADYHNRFDETDNNIVIFGHNTQDGSMFGSLKNILSEDWQKANNKIILVTENDTYYYQVFSTYEIIPEDYYINTQFQSIDEFYEFVNNIKNRSNYNYNIEIYPNDKILTLSSCTATGTKRVVLHAKLINK